MLCQRQSSTKLGTCGCCLPVGAGVRNHFLHLRTSICSPGYTRVSTDLNLLAGPCRGPVSSALQTTMRKSMSAAPHHTHSTHLVRENQNKKIKYKWNSAEWHSLIFATMQVHSTEKHRV